MKTTANHKHVGSSGSDSAPMNHTPTPGDAFWPELAAAGLSESHPHYDWIANVYLLGRKFIELARQMPSGLHPALVTAICFDLKEQAIELVGDKSPFELTEWPEIIAKRAAEGDKV